MKNYIDKTIMVIAICMCGCSDVLDLEPMSELTAANFFLTDNDFQIYSNQFYEYLPLEGGGGAGFIWEEDNNSDNQLQNLEGNIFAFGANTIDDEPGDYGGGGWDFSDIRTVNYFLDNLETSSIEESAKDKWRAEGRFFRAWLYFDKLRKYGDVPWFDKALSETDPDVYKPRDPRATVVSNILADLDFAAANITREEGLFGTRGGKEYIDRFAVLALKARVALYEGTFRKYHGLSESPADMLNAAIQASEVIMNEGGFALHTDGGPSLSYYNYFSMVSPNTSSETILARSYSASQNVTNWSQRFLSGSPKTGFSKSIADDYLCLDGLPISLSPLFNASTDYDFIEVEMGNRDPRMAQSIWNHGDLVFFNPEQYYSPPPLSVNFNTGYSIKKFSNQDRNLTEDGQGVDGIHIFRLGEIYLIYAEAKAELGTLSQADLDISINLLRDRVGMPHMVIADLQRDPDSDFDGSISEIPAVSVLIDEIRRERRVELAGEGMRRDDIVRWKAGQLLAKDPLGAKFNPDRYPDLIGESFTVTNADGFLEPYQGATIIRQFDENKNYLYPIPPSEIGLYSNGALKQNPGWQ